MQYINRLTGDVFLYLATAKNVETMKHQVIFCAADSEQDIFIMSMDKFNVEYKVIDKLKNAA